MKKANVMVRGKVVTGEGRGRGLGFPTANISIEEKVPVESGVYASNIRVKSVWYPAATSVGANVTFGETTPTVETHLLDFDGDIVGENVELEFVKRVRGMEKFESVEELMEQMKRDVREIRKITKALKHKGTKTPTSLRCFSA